MPQPAPTIRKLEPPSAGDFDEQLWPVNLALLLVCGCVAGWIIAVSDFSASDFWGNGWVRLVTLVSSVALLCGLAVYIGGPRARRLQLAAFLSIALHLTAGMVVHVTSQSDVKLGVKDAAGPRKLRDIDVLPDYHITPPQVNRTPDVIERPAETAAPEQKPLDIARPPIATDRSVPIPLKSGDNLAGDFAPKAVVAMLDRKPLERSDPKREDVAPKLAKQTAPQNPTPAPATVVAPNVSTPSTIANPLEARAIPRGHQTVDPTVKGRPDETAIAMLPKLSAAGPRPANLPRADNQPAPSLGSTPALAKVAAPKSPFAASAQPTASGANPAPSATTGPLNAAAIQVARGTTQPNAPARAAAPDLNGPAGSGGFGTSLAMAGPLPGRTKLSSGPNPDPNLPAIGPAAKLPPGFSGAAAGPIAVPAAGLPAPGGPGGIAGTSGSAAPSDMPANGPARVGIARSRGGPIGPGRGEGFDIGVANGPPQVTVTPALGSGGGLARNSGVGAGASGGPNVGIGQPGGLARSVTGGAAPAGVVAVNPLGNDVTLGAGNGPANGSLEVASISGAQRSQAAGPIGGGSGLGGTGNTDVGSNTPGMSIGIGTGAGGGPGRIQAGDQPAIGAGVVGGQLPRTIGGAGGKAGVATVAGGDVASPIMLPGATGNGGPGGSGGDGIGPGGPIADSRATGAVRSIPGGGIPGGSAIGSGRSPSDGPGGDGGGGGGGVIGAAQIGRPGAGTAENLPGGMVGGVRGGLGTGIGRAGPATPGGLAADVKADLPQLGAGVPNGNGSVASGNGGNGPGGDGTGTDGTGGNGPGGLGGPANVASIGRQSTGGLPGVGLGGSGTGANDTVGNAGPGGPGEGGSGLGGNGLGGPGAGTGASGIAGFGIPDRRATAEPDQSQLSAGRFLQRQAGGGGPSLVADSPERAPTPAFSGRGRAGHGPRGNGENGDADGRTEVAVERGLAYLAQMQAPDGSWSLHNFPGATVDDAGTYRSDTAATGLALLSFLGAGYDHFDDKYHDTVRRGLESLLRHQRADGELYVSVDPNADQAYWSRMYSHAIASLALCEALGMTGDKKLREPAQRAVNFIIACQDKSRGGWRYDPGDGSDTSLTGWQTTALRSGKLAGLDVPDECFARVARFLDTVQVSANDASRYLYRPQDRLIQREADSQRPTMTAVGLLARIYSGWNRDNPNLARGGDLIRANLPKATDYFSRDTYYWYYATQVMFHLRGDYWKAWSERLFPLLINSQVVAGPLAGSWDPRGRVRDRWGIEGGRLYVTTMNLLSLEVYFRHLPIYDLPAAGK